jgi:hypothetical protein
LKSSVVFLPVLALQVATQIKARKPDAAIRVYQQSFLDLDVPVRVENRVAHQFPLLTAGSYRNTLATSISWRLSMDLFIT